MKIGTKSVLFGAHCFFIHPWFVALGWWKLYGFPWDPRLWVAFFVHDLGYWGKSDLDGEEEGELHPFWGADIMSRLFDWGPRTVFYEGPQHGTGKPHLLGYWGHLTLFHSRFLAKRYGQSAPSALCAPDKLAICLEPCWLYLPRVFATGEIHEYMADAKYVDEGRITSQGARAWHASMVRFLRDEWVPQNQTGGPDTITTVDRMADSTGVWR